MKIVKYKKTTNNKYQVILENNEKVNLYEDVILEKDLLLKKEINNLEDILNTNMKYDIYEKSLKYINIRLRSIYELKEYLLKNNYSEEDINKTIDKLIKNGYLNDEYYSKCYINDRINLSLDGPEKIKKYLEDMNINRDIFMKYLEVFDNNLIKERINKYISKQLKTNKKSMYIFKNKMFIMLSNLGYSRLDINDCLNSIEFDNQSELRDREKEKLYKKLSRKYSGEELERKIREKLYQKGFFE